MADPPLINPNWLTDPTDVQVAIAGYKRVRELFATSALAPVLIGPEYFPGSSVQTDSQLLTLIRESLGTVFHAAATCSMGKISDPDAVLDSKARVIGVQSLRVVDASAFPLLPPGHPQATVCKTFTSTMLLCYDTYSSFCRCPCRENRRRYKARILVYLMVQGHSQHIHLGFNITGAFWEAWYFFSSSCLSCLLSLGALLLLSLLRTRSLSQPLDYPYWNTYIAVCIRTTLAPIILEKLSQLRRV